MSDSSSACKICGDRSGLCSCRQPGDVITAQAQTVVVGTRVAMTMTAYAGVAPSHSGYDPDLMVIAPSPLAFHKWQANVVGSIRALEEKLKCLDPVEATGCGFTFAETMSLKWAEVANAEEKAGRRK